MAMVHHYVPGYKNVPLIRENDHQLPGLYSPTPRRTPEVLLEEEIDRLRLQLEQMIREERSLTSDAVVEMSRILDVKINEYNQFWSLQNKKKKRSK